MVDFAIPCDTFARLAYVTNHTLQPLNPWFLSIRIENNLALASNRKVLVVEKLPWQNPGVVHVPITPEIIALCEAEKAIKSNLHVSYEPVINFASLQTTRGAKLMQGNGAVMCTEPNDFDKWREKIVDIAREPVKKSNGGMYWDAEDMANLAASSPSGRLVFPEFINVEKPTVIRDINDYDWFAVWVPSMPNRLLTSATLPIWI